MNPTRFYHLLDRAVRTTLDDEALVFGQGDAGAAGASALRAYSRYRPILRRMGTGVLLEPVIRGAESLLVLGGPFRAGQTLTLDGLGGTPEAVIVGGLGLHERGMRDALGCLEITVASATTYAHSAGALLTADSPGLAIQSGVDTYALPFDWMEVDQDSFDLAIGARAAPVRQGGFFFFGGIYQQSAQLSGIGYGLRGDFGSGFGQSVGTPAGLFGLPADATNQIRYLFHSDLPPRLTIVPAPVEDRLLDFWYQGCHTLETVPESDGDALVAYATYVALSAQSAQVARLEDRVAGDERALYSKSREGLNAEAQSALARFERLLADRPFSTGG